MSNELKIFLIKVIVVVIAIILIINSTYNLIFASKIEPLFQILNKPRIENKIREELSRALEKDKIFYEEDRMLLKKLYIKLKKEFESE